MKIKKITLGLIFGSLAFSILFLVIFAIVTYSIFSPFINGLIPFVVLLTLAGLSIYCFLNQMIVTGSFIERYLENHGFLKDIEDDFIEEVIEENNEEEE